MANVTNENVLAALGKIAVPGAVTPRSAASTFSLVTFAILETPG